MSKSPDWIVILQDELHLTKYLGPVIWVNKCLRCGQEEPTYSGPASVAIFQGKEFIRRHKNCKPKENSISHEYRTSHLKENFPGKNMGD